MKNTLAVVAVASFVGTVCQAAASLPDSLLACRKLADEGERVRCYDAQIDKLKTPVNVRAAAPANKATQLQPAAAAVAATQGSHATDDATVQFGKETLPAAARLKVDPQDEVALDSTIKSLKKLARAKYAISLANGQVWQQEEASDISLFFKVGDSVRIEKGSLGAYRMSTSATGAKNWVRVSRLQ